MYRHFVRTEPLQAGKLATFVVTLLVTADGITGLLPTRGFASLFLVVILSIGLALTIAVETLSALSRAVRAERSLAAQYRRRPTYAIVRAFEVRSAVAWAGALGYLLRTLPERTPSGPGAIGVLFMVTGISLVVIGGSLVRSLAEWYFFWRGERTARSGR